MSSTTERRQSFGITSSSSEPNWVTRYTSETLCTTGAFGWRDDMFYIAGLVHILVWPVVLEHRRGGAKGPLHFRFCDVHRPSGQRCHQVAAAGDATVHPTRNKVVHGIRHAIHPLNGWTRCADFNTLLHCYSIPSKDIFQHSKMPSKCCRSVYF